MIKLINETADMHKPYTAVRNIEIELDDEASLDEMLDAFKRFLQASGYTINGYLDIIEEEDYGNNSTVGAGGDFSSVHRDEAATLTVSIGDEEERTSDDHDGGMLRSGC